MIVEVVPDLSAVDATEWDALCGDDNPFIEHAFLQLLESSGSVGPGTGWLPAHVLVRDDDALVAAAPCYLKDDSYGEYIFDWGWANAAENAGLRYYPKLVVAVPFTPATGPRILTHPARERAPLVEVMGEALLAVCDQLEASSVHVLFCMEEEAELLSTSEHYFRRGTHQFHFRNPGYEDFDDFLGHLRSSARKQLRKERRRVHASDLELSLTEASALSKTELETMFRLYISTSNRKWGSPYLTREFFLNLDRLGDRALLAFARRDDAVVAGALSFGKGAHLYGRYWGCHDHVDNLHFELCYYQLIDKAIREGKALVEAGAQGPHKLKRGFLPVMTHSVHHCRHPGLQRALSEAMAMERQHLEIELAQIQSEGPFRDDGRPPYRPSAGIPLARVKVPDFSQ